MTNDELLQKAQAGDELSLQKLLARWQRRLLTRVERRLPARLAGAVSPEDILQDAFVDVFRGIARFQDNGESAFYRWLVTIVDNRLIDTIRALQAAKRGGEWARLTETESQAIPLVEMLEVNSRTPSRSIARREAVGAVIQALDEIAPDYREALQLRFVEGLNVSETAQRLGRTEWAVHKLCRRGLDQLRVAMGDAGNFLSES
ncbi:MAG: sigma-70 family RNA polymerase sigma factor [Phycisphaerales bacterium]|nr:sigma-70 family RNA polymerase sigma factor [Phycisphaerales bacterium]